MSIIINNKQYEIPELKTVSWKDGISWVKEATDKSPRTKLLYGSLQVVYILKYRM